MIIQQAVDDFIASLCDNTHLWLAYSGGVDSHVLLHSLHQAVINRPTLTLHAIHINHQLQPQAKQWQQHCGEVCQTLAIDYHSESIEVTPIARQSLEAIARNKRYQALTKRLNRDDYLITAHHQNDQAETLLLQLLRGAGPQGLAAMPMVTTLAPGYLARPLLPVSRNTIVNYAEIHQLRWVEDDSNQSLQFERNFLRHKLLPQILQRYPSAYRTITRSAKLCGETSELTAALATIDLSASQIPKSPNELSVEKVKKLSRARQRNLVRYWLTQQKIPLPSAIKLRHIIEDVIHSRYEATPCVTLSGTHIRRQKNRIFLCQDNNTTE
ncbi:MAG: tRNA lysidine(34) synthetase TilS [Gammaproteobacteria bacterium]|nr:tRNA lysidine(34) synthetase TilS [Gammaproteobacteria bacterium]